MKNLTVTVASVVLLFGALLFGPAHSMHAQSDKAKAGAEVIEEEQLDAMVVKIAELVESKYIHAEMGREMGEHIKTNHQKGKYKNITYEGFGKQLREDFVEFSGDVHMNAFFLKPKKIPRTSPLANRMDDWGGPTNFGFLEFRISEDNIGYLKIAHFGRWKFFDEQRKTATRCIGMLENTNALVIDVRGNPGGFEDIVAHVMSYFFDQAPFHLQKYYCRYEDRSRSIGTTDVPGKRLPDLPIYILVDKDTGSAAESLAYMMKHLKRATIVGETTVGAGNGSTYFKVTDSFSVQIATWETINAITKTSWEKAGVIPDIKTTSEGALDKAMELAKVAGKAYRTNVVDGLLALIRKLDQAIDNHPAGISDEELLAALAKCQESEIYRESAINIMGYSLLREKEQPKTAEVVLGANILFYPNSANARDSYGDALAANGKLQEARAAYEKAVAIGREVNDPDLSLYIQNLEKLKKRME